MAKTKSSEVNMNRRGSDDRRDNDRRKQNIAVAVDRRQNERRKAPRRRQIDPTTCERDYSDEEIQFMHALDAYKRASGRMFPTCSEILEVLRHLGYTKTSPATIESPIPTLSPLDETTIIAEPVSV